MFCRFCITEIVKNEEKTIGWFLDNIAFLHKYGLGAIYFTDSGSSDSTKDIVRERAKDFVVPIYLYESVFVDFGTNRTEAMRRAGPEFPWILLIDPDERVYESECQDIQTLLNADVELWYLPRKKWKDFNRETQAEIGFYPDKQGTLVRNIPRIHYKGSVHEMITGHVGERYHAGPMHKHHFEPCWRTSQELTNKYRLYRELRKAKS
jgi:glycosyltransferase involved in cell wall biosynthesis